MAASVVASVALPISNNFSFAPSMDAYGKLNDYGKLGAWSPLSLFASGEQGAWYDPSDLTTMFQDRAGTTPVTADGQTVGLILDKSKGLVLGSELITNGTFDTDATGWTAQNATLSVTGGQLTVTTVAPGNYGISKQAISTVIGKKYRCDSTAVNSNSLAWIAKSDNSTIPFGTNSVRSPIDGVGTGFPITARWWFTGTATTSYIFLCSSTTAGNNVVFDNISIKEYDGNHATAPSDAARPLKTSTGLSKWINYDAVDDVLNTTFTSSLGSSCTVCRANVGGAPTILTGQTIGTSYADSTDNAGLIIINRALTAQETTDVTAWLTAKGAT